jgi:hypothetical protein
MGIKSHEVIFNESYHSEWRLFPAKTFSWWKAPFIKPLADTKEAHVLYNEYANKWTLNEGEMDLAKDEKGESGFVLYFLPQSYFYYGLIVSLSTFLYLSFSLLRNRFKHSTKK